MQTCCWCGKFDIPGNDELERNPSTYDVSRNVHGSGQLLMHGLCSSLAIEASENWCRKLGFLSAHAPKECEFCHEVRYQAGTTIREGLVDFDFNGRAAKPVWVHEKCKDTWTMGWQAFAEELNRATSAVPYVPLQTQRKRAIEEAARAAEGELAMALPRELYEHPHAPTDKCVACRVVGAIEKLAEKP